ncbi:MAG: alanine--tRNA ligase, partial [Anaerolineae bacterium]
WEFVTQDLSLSPDRLWITIYLDDDEAQDLWMKVGVPEARILRFGKSENWWGPAGETGPCGPDSEIFYDRGEKHGCGRPDCAPNCPYCDRYLELWNLVFMQYHQDETGELTPLPEQNIDTGMGLERTAVVMQEASSIYETDLFYPLVKRAAELVGVEYGSHGASDRSLRIIAEHGRAATFLITDGVMPANEGRGYVLRRILRKAIYHGRHLGREEPFLGEIARVVGDLMGEAYPELIDRAEFVVQVMTVEEERFQQTLDTGTHLLVALLEDPEVIERGVISGQDVFRLYDTYGLPPDFTREIAKERGIDIDEEGFEEAMAAQQERARAARRAVSYSELPAVIRGPDVDETEFVGYEKLECEARIVSLARMPEGTAPVGQWVHPDESVDKGEQVQVLLDITPFYAEAGGQVADTGILVGPRGRIRVTDTQSPRPGYVVHYGIVEEGTLKKGDRVRAQVDKERRLDIARNHTATHLLHKALREVLGGHARQSGSLVAPDRLRFDFTHMAALTPEELGEIERRVNARIRENLPVTAQVMDYDRAIAAGAVAIFGEKYGDRVRMVSIDDYTKELCGGTHLRATGEIGLFHIVGEESIGAGLRRIEALTGRGAERYMQEALTTLAQVADRLQVPPVEVGDKVASLQESLKEKEREVARLRREKARSEVDSLLEKVTEVEGVKLLAAQVRADDIESLREMTDWVRDRLGSVVVVLGAVLDGKPGFVAAVTPDLVERGLRADWLVKEVANLVGGGGGGRATLAQAGGRDASKLQEALAAVEGFLADRL